MAVTIKREGYGQLEPNHLTAPRNGGVYAQLPADDSIEVLEQGMFVKYDMSAGKVAFTGEGPWMKRSSMTRKHSVIVILLFARLTCMTRKCIPASSL